ncbi:MAG: EamA family transporter, partial [Phyllobacteriaceae bacterium]|nr:EamA family transporter [Phyllobacteriaceae bacterium]
VAGLVLASGGLIALVAPGLGAPPPLATAAMAAAGVAWGVYSLRGRGVGDAIAATSGNFLRATPMALAVALVASSTTSLDPVGVGWAIASGAAASGLGYAIWYTVLPALAATTAAIVQLTVPVIAAVAAVLFLGETATWRLAFASAAILGGIAMVVLTRRRPPRIDAAAAPPPDREADEASQS